MRRQTPLYTIGYRPALLLGGERWLVFLGLGLSSVLAYAGVYDVRALGVAATVLTVMMVGWRALAKADPQMWQVLSRYYTYRQHYIDLTGTRHDNLITARSGPFRSRPTLKPREKGY